MQISENAVASGPDALPPPPLAGGPLGLGTALGLARDPVRLLLDGYRRHGPVFRLRVVGKEVAVLAGLEANQFAQRQGHLVLTNEKTFADLTLELGSSLNMAVLEGERHKFFRKTAARGYSREAFQTSIPGAAFILRRFLAGLAPNASPDSSRNPSPNSSFDVFTTMQRLISLQLGLAAAHTDAAACIDDLQKFMRFLLNVHLTGAWPRLVLRTRAYRQAKASSHAFVDGVIDFHRRHPPGSGPEPRREPDLIDGFLAAHDSDPETVPLEAVRSAAFGPFLAGQDTVAATTAFTLYEVLSRPAVLERVEADVERLFREGLPDGGRFNEATSLRQAAVETMRLHPVAPMMPQHSSAEFEFAGHRVRAGQPVFMAQTLTHFLPEYFERPFEFLLDRPKPQPLTYAPFGLGPHTCIGAAMGELQVMANVALLLRMGRFSIVPADYRLRTKTIPPAPKGFRLRLDELRELPAELAEACVLPDSLWRPRS